VQKVREEVAEKERDEHFNTIRPVIPIKQEWGVKEKVDVTAPMTSDDDIDLLVMTGLHRSRAGVRHQLAWTSTWCSRYRPNSEVPRRRSLRCFSTPRRSCLRIPNSQAST
jgi:hypothetical protein